MQILVFFSDDGTPNGSGPILFIQDHPSASLPPHPRDLQWRYHANIALDDEIFVAQGAEALEGLLRDGYYMTSGTKPQ